MKKKYCILINGILLLWFFLDMIGLCFGDQYLVTRSYQEDGIFFFIFLVAILLFVCKEKVGKMILSVWLSLWLIIQFMAHEWYTLFGKGFMGKVEDKILYFKDTIKWTNSEIQYVPDVYHTILHLLILLALVVTVLYIIQTKNKSECK